MSKIEVESRVILTPDERTEMLAYMHTLGNVRPIARAAVFYASKDEQGRAQTLRANNGAIEYVAKAGDLTADARDEETMTFSPDITFDAALAFVAWRGHTRGTVARRRMFVVETPEFEYSLRDVVYPDGERASTLFELEASKAHVAEVGAAAAFQDTQHTLATLGHAPLDKARWKAWVSIIETRVDQPFNFTPAAAADLTASLVAADFLTQRFAEPQ